MVLFAAHVGPVTTNVNGGANADFGRKAWPNFLRSRWARDRTTSVNQRAACFFWTNHAARLRYMRRKNRALVPSMNLDTPHPMNAAAGLCVLARIGAAHLRRGPRSAHWVGEGQPRCRPDCFCGPDSFRKM